MTESALMQDYRNQRNHYFANAIETINQHEYRKAAELLWGAVAQELKRVYAALHDDARFSRHRVLNEVAKELVTLTGDSSLAREYRDLQLLHNYFYDEESLIYHDLEFKDLAERAKRFIDRLEEIIDSLPDKPVVAESE